MMGARSDGRPITHYARSWAQQQAALDRPQYNIVRVAGGWQAERVHPDGSITTLALYLKRGQAETAVRLLAGHGGDITVKDYVG